MSAYAALKDTSSIASIFHEAEDGEDTDIVRYELNSSDEEAEIPTIVDTNSIRASSAPKVSYKPSNLISHSRFIPSSENLIFGEDEVIIGLKVNEFVVLNGQCELNVQRGAVLMNNHHYMFAEPIYYKIFAPASQSLPVISSTQVLDRSIGIQDTMTPENSHLFNSDYKSVIVLRNFHTGAENIGEYYSPFKRLLYSKLIFDESDEIGDYEKLFFRYSFEIILRDRGFNALYLDRPWSATIERLGHSMNKQQLPKVIMIIGNKNSGKSTASKAILNTLLLRGDSPVSYLELDPGQPEFSYPYSLSLREITKPVFGMCLPSSSSCSIENTVEHYFGFSSPIHEPKQYIRIIKSLIKSYRKLHALKGNHLVINTPGWIRGYGKEILMEVTQIVNPDFLLLLTSSLDKDHPDNLEILQNLHYQNLDILPGIFNTSKYSPSQIRNFSKLLYFHQLEAEKFDFNGHILDSSPFRISYETVNSVETFTGVSSFTMLNFDVGKDFNYEDIVLMMDSTIVGVYLVDAEVHHTIKNYRHPSTLHNTLPLYLNSSQFVAIVGGNDSQGILYMGLSMIHSINRTLNYLNMYMPCQNSDKIKSLIEHGYTVYLVRGEGEIPSSEILNLTLLIKQISSQSAKSNIIPVPYPYVSFEKKSRIGGIWKIRRNVKRRAYQ